MNWIEIVGAVLSVIYLVLSVKQNIWLWLFGFISSALYVVVFFQSKFYADMSLQFYYLAVSVYGFWHWKFGTPKAELKLPVISVTPKGIAALSAIAMLLWAAYYLTLTHFTDSDIAVADALTTALSIVATWMLVHKIVEHWLVWIFVNSFSSYLYFHKELYPTTILFILYTIMAIVGYVQWKKDKKKEDCKVINLTER